MSYDKHLDHSAFNPYGDDHPIHQESGSGHYDPQPVIFGTDTFNYDFLMDVPLHGVGFQNPIQNTSQDSRDILEVPFQHQFQHELQHPFQQRSHFLARSRSLPTDAFETSGAGPSMPQWNAPPHPSPGDDDFLEGIAPSVHFGDLFPIGYTNPDILSSVGQMGGYSQPSFLNASSHERGQTWPGTSSGQLFAMDGPMVYHRSHNIASAPRPLGPSASAPLLLDYSAAEGPSPSFGSDRSNRNGGEPSQSNKRGKKKENGKGKGRMGRKGKGRADEPPEDENQFVLDDGLPADLARDQVPLHAHEPLWENAQDFDAHHFSPFARPLPTSPIAGPSNLRRSPRKRTATEPDKSTSKRRKVEHVSEPQPQEPPQVSGGRRCLWPGCDTEECFYDWTKIGDHLKEAHSSHKAPECLWPKGDERCGSSFRKGNWRRHMGQHFTNVTCRVCGKKLSRPDSLARHRRSACGESQEKTLRPKKRSAKGKGKGKGRGKGKRQSKGERRAAERDSEDEKDAGEEDGETEE